MVDRYVWTNVERPLRHKQDGGGAKVNDLVTLVYIDARGSEEIGDETGDGSIDVPHDKVEVHAG